MSNLMNDLVSIIMPAYRVEKIISDSIHSVLNQSYSNWELLIADDCSPDGTAAVVSKFSTLDPRIKLISCITNGGPASARNSALSVAKGRWIAFLDSDDIWLPSKLDETIRHSVHMNAAITYTGFCRTTHDLTEVGDYISVPNSLSYQQLLGNTAIATSTVLIDRNITGNILMEKVFYDDFVCWLGILKKGLIAHGLNKDLMRYRVVSNSVSRNKKRSALEVWKVYRKVERIGLIKSFWYFSSYTINAFLKYRKF